MPALGNAEVSCSRGGLQQAVDLYLAAQAKGDPSGLPLATGVGYWENMARVEGGMYTGKGTPANTPPPNAARP